jgi:hypothetical protein
MKPDKPTNVFSLTMAQISDYFLKEYKKFRRDLDRQYREDLQPEEDPLLSEGRIVTKKSYLQRIRTPYLQIKKALFHQRNHIRTNTEHEKHK